jgi:Flp pilus assembly pilin Flp
MGRNFINDETGAVTVDWVVLTAGIVGVAIGVAAVVSGGVEDLAGDTGDALSGFDGWTSFSTATTLFSNDFSAGLGGFIGGSVQNVLGFGEVLQLGPGEATTATFDVPEGATSATVSFDMLGLDDLSGEGASILINGQEVAFYADDHGNITTQDMGVTGVSVSVNQVYSNDPVGSGSHGNDSRATYTITVANPGETVTFGVASQTGQPISEEFYAIDDVSFSAS